MIRGVLSSQCLSLSVFVRWGGRSVCAVLLLAMPLFSAPQVVSLKSGERIVGEVLPRSNAETLVLKSNLLGELSLSRSQVLKIEPQVPPAVVVDLPKSGNGPKAAVAKAKAPEVKATPQEKATEVAIAERMEEVEEILEEEQPIVDRLLAFKAPESWNGNIRLGMNMSTGDNKWTETAMRGKLEIQPKGNPNYYRFTGAYTYRETERSNGDKYKSTDRYDGAFIYRRSFAGNWFVQNAMSARFDQVKGIEHEYQELLGVGYKFKLKKQFEFLLGGGGGAEEYKTTFDDSRNGLNPVMNVFQEFTWKPFKRTSVVQKFNYYWNPDYSKQYNYVLTAALRVRLTDLLGFEFGYSQIYDNDIGDGNQRDDSVWRNALILYF